MSGPWSGKVGDLRQGQLVWAEVIDPNGTNPKFRPLVVVSDPRQLQQDDDIVTVAVTSSPTAPPNECVDLPWEAKGHPRTGLSKPCVAVCTWNPIIKAAAISKIGGIVPKAKLLTILEKLLGTEQ